MLDAGTSNCTELKSSILGAGEPYKHRSAKPIGEECGEHCTRVMAMKQIRCNGLDVMVIRFQIRLVVPSDIDDP